MSASTAIGMVSESLRTLLVEEMTLTPAVDVTILAPDETGGDRRINLFLYRVHENVTLKNAEWRVKRGAPTQLTPPPLALNLYYLLTSYAPNDPLTGNATAHAILGEAMRVFHQHAIVPNNRLVSGLRDAREQIQIMLSALDLEELSRVWGTFSHPFRLSVMYEVSVVELELLGEQPMGKRVQQVGVPDIQASFQPPIVNDLTPLRGPVGTPITIQGQHLAGWQASVTMMRKRVVDGVKLTTDAITGTIPVGLPPGIHQLQVDVAHLHRRVFFFEVTPS